MIARFALAGALLCALLSSPPARGCEVALLLSVDVSSSIDLGEFRLQADGMADALADPAIAEALVRGQIALAVMQWSGVGRQRLVLGWTRMRGPADVAGFGARSRAMERAFVHSDTAIGDALLYGLAQFGPVADCARKVIDVSGDGTRNAGSPTRDARRQAEIAGIIVNGIAIESLGVAVTGYYRRSLITHDGFVVTARGHLDYPRAIKAKIRREVTKVTG